MASWNICDSGNTHNFSQIIYILSVINYTVVSTSVENTAASHDTPFGCYDDLYLVRQFISELNPDFWTDSDRIMASGVSNGSTITYYN